MTSAAYTALVPSYFPDFIWKLWLAESAYRFNVLDSPRVHVYDIVDNNLSEVCQVPTETRSIFRDFDVEPDNGWSDVLIAAETAFLQLEVETATILTNVAQRVRSAGGTGKGRISLPRNSLHSLRKYFIFLRFRNSPAYSRIVETTCRPETVPEHLPPATYHARQTLLRIRRRVAINNFRTFLQHNWADMAASKYPCDPALDSGRKAVAQYCWQFCNADVCIGVATEKNEFLLTDLCYGTLDEDGIHQPDSDLFFPVTPTVALYMFSEPSDFPDRHRTTARVEYDTESTIDIHLRNAMLLRSNPRRLYFSSLLSITQSISSYDEFRWTGGHQDFSRLKQRCRQKHTKEEVSKTLTIKGTLFIMDLTADVERIGDEPVAHGSFSDVWKGVWTEPGYNKSRLVALKVLRLVMVQNVREKLYKRLTDEIAAWYRLSHPNVAKLFGVVQTFNTIAMVSPWCENSTVTHYLSEQPSVDRLALLSQIAAGVAYLHGCQPPVVHGDLKGSNILVNDKGLPMITDFGLSKVMATATVSETTPPGSSFIAGTTRYMAPELVLALVEDDGRSLPISTRSDVYAFCSVALEIATGSIPYAHRTNDHAVCVDILRGIKPSRGLSCYINPTFREEFWSKIEEGWDQVASLRPSMAQLASFLEGLQTN